MKYSVCITHYNCARTVRVSLKSLLSQLDSNFEVVIVDNRSTDGSLDILKEYESEGMIRLLSTRCSRGEGRQLALQRSEGEYVVSGLDMDDTFRPSLQNLLKFYHDRTEGMLLSGAGEATMIAPRKLLLDLGGWKNLQFRENWELCRRAAEKGMYRWTIFPLVSQTNQHDERKKRLQSLKYRFIRYRENIRVGHKIFDTGERRGISQSGVYMLAKISAFLSEKYPSNFYFRSIDTRYFVDSRNYWPDHKMVEKERMLYNLLLQEELII